MWRHYEDMEINTDQRSKTERVLLLTAHFRIMFMQFSWLEITRGLSLASWSQIFCLMCQKHTAGFTFVALSFYFGARIFNSVFVKCLFLTVHQSKYSAVRLTCNAISTICSVKLFVCAAQACLYLPRRHDVSSSAKDYGSESEGNHAGHKMWQNAAGQECGTFRWNRVWMAGGSEQNVL